MARRNPKKKNKRPHLVTIQPQTLATKQANLVPYTKGPIRLEGPHYKAVPLAEYPPEFPKGYRRATGHSPNQTATVKDSQSTNPFLYASTKTVYFEEAGHHWLFSVEDKRGRRAALAIVDPLCTRWRMLYADDVPAELTVGHKDPLQVSPVSAFHRELTRARAAMASLAALALGENE